MTVRALPHVCCTIQRNPSGGHTPTLHLPTTIATAPTPSDPRLGSLTSALQFAKHRYPGARVMFPTPPSGDAA